MRHLIICSLILFFTNTVVFTFAQAPSIQWAKCYGGSEYEEAYTALQTNDGGFVIGGITGSTDGDVVGNHTTGFARDMWIIKVDDTGNLQWQMCFVGLATEEAKCIRQTRKRGFIIAGKAS